MSNQEYYNDNLDAINKRYEKALEDYYEIFGDMLKLHYQTNAEKIDNVFKATGFSGKAIGKKLRVDESLISRWRYKDSDRKATSFDIELICKEFGIPAGFFHDDGCPFVDIRYVYDIAVDNDEVLTLVKSPITFEKKIEGSEEIIKKTIAGVIYYTDDRETAPNRVMIVRLNGKWHRFVSCALKPKDYLPYSIENEVYAVIDYKDNKIHYCKYVESDKFKNYYLEIPKRNNISKLKRKHIPNEIKIRKRNLHKQVFFDLGEINVLKTFAPKE